MMADKIVRESLFLALFGLRHSEVRACSAAAAGPGEGLTKPHATLKLIAHQALETGHTMHKSLAG